MAELRIFGGPLDDKQKTQDHESLRGGFSFLFII